MTTQPAPQGAKSRASGLLCMTAMTLACLASWPSEHALAAAAEKDLPGTLQPGHVVVIEGPADDTAYARGAMGLVRNSYGRASLYVAWRLMQLPPGAVAKESHDRRSTWGKGLARPTPDVDEIEAWLQLRATVQPKPLASKPDYYRDLTIMLGGSPAVVSQGQCGADAFAFATRLLASLKADSALSDTHRQWWVAGQDAVFARCAWSASLSKAPPALPALLPDGAPAKLVALNAYQRAAALFYGEDHAGALKAFDAISADKAHPMRPWAVLGAMRSLVRGTVRDDTWEKAFQDAYGRRGLRAQALRDAMTPVNEQRQQREAAMLADLDARFTAAMADASLAPAHEAFKYTVRRALWQMRPARPFMEAMAALGKPEQNPYAHSALDTMRELHDSVVPRQPTEAVRANLRKHAWYDFVSTVQACADLPKVADTATCDREHAYALGRWKETGSATWMLASLMTAREPSPADLPVAMAARQADAARPEWASLQFHAARVLKAQGQAEEAQAALMAVRQSGKVHKRDRPLLDEALKAR